MMADDDRFIRLWHDAPGLWDHNYEYWSSQGRSSVNNPNRRTWQREKDAIRRDYALAQTIHARAFDSEVDGVASGVKRQYMKAYDWTASLAEDLIES